MVEKGVHAVPTLRNRVVIFNIQEQYLPCQQTWLSPDCQQTSRNIVTPPPAK